MFNTINNHSNLSNYTNRITARVHQNISQSNTETSIKTTSNKADSKTVLGYAVDKDGYFTSEFNKAAGIPDDFKIHSSTMESLVRSEKNTIYLAREFRDIDIAKTIGNAYKMLSQLVGEDMLNNPNKQSFSKDEIAAFPQGYEFNRQTLEVTKIHSSIFDYVNAGPRFDYPHNGNITLTSTFFNDSVAEFTKTPKYKPATNIFNNNNGGKEGENGVFFDTTAEKYTNADGSVTKGGLLVALVNSNRYLREGETTYMGKLAGMDKNIDSNTFNAQHAAWMAEGRRWNSYSKQEIANMSQDKREYVMMMQELQRSISTGTPFNSNFLENDSINTSVDNVDNEQQYLDPISAMLKALDEQMKEHLKKIQKKAIETRQKEQEALMKKDIENFEKLSKEAKKAMEEFTNFIDNLQESYNTDKDKKKRVYIDSNYLKDALHALADDADSKKDIEGFSIRV